VSDAAVNIVIPMAGAGSRFQSAGYPMPKPFVPVNGVPMIVRVMENLAVANARFILIARAEHLAGREAWRAEVEARFRARIVTIDQLTEGTAATLLFARAHYANDEMMVVANSDQLVDGGLEPMVADCLQRGLDGSIMVFRDAERNPKWSFARLGASGLVSETREKVAISDLATVGIYAFRRGRDFVEAAVDMIIRNVRTNNEFYTCPVYNQLIGQGQRIGVFEVAPDAMHGVGTPEDLDAYLRLSRT
jgi:UDP-N-acetylglucosamine diphosphorylase / glucose-1-phosphate thymidylyltransferase / UDP-N-acetylgalactosamine diphosphorylase / glucosamine-1-phosphate N-acetyltransferase / galactosamine-1-phosphate N-acetyltransferase